MPPLITLTTDFGTRDPYVASMKGVILSICPEASIVDLSHDITPQDILEGALFIAEASRWFPSGTVHCVVIDPGVGTSRSALAASGGGQKFVCPDNGLLTFVNRRTALDEVRAIAKRPFVRDAVSATFHGRDVFAPAAAQLALGTSLADAGEQVGALHQLDVPAVRRMTGSYEGEVMHVDRFGNCITNIHRAEFARSGWTQVRVGGVSLPGIQKTYADVAAGEPLALFGSADYLEIAVNCGDACKALGLKRGSRVEIGLFT